MQPFPCVTACPCTFAYRSHINIESCVEPRGQHHMLSCNDHHLIYWQWIAHKTGVHKIGCPSWLVLLLVPPPTSTIGFTGLYQHAWHYTCLLEIWANGLILVNQPSYQLITSKTAFLKCIYWRIKTNISILKVSIPISELSIFQLLKCFY